MRGLAGRRAIVLLSTLQALRGITGWTGYATTKGALISLARQAAVEYALDGIRVNAAAPGTILPTALNEDAYPLPGRVGPRPRHLHRVSARHDPSPYLRCLKLDGTLCVLGIPQRWEVDPLSLLLGRKSLSHGRRAIPLRTRCRMALRNSS